MPLTPSRPLPLPGESQGEGYGLPHGPGPERTLHLFLGGRDGTRTRNLRMDNPLLSRLSYAARRWQGVPDLNRCCLFERQVS